MSQLGHLDKTYKQWHLLVYIKADNSLYNDALTTLRQLTEGSRLNNVKITVQFEGPTLDDIARYSCKDGKRSLIEAPNDRPATPDQRLRDFLVNAPVDPKNERIFLILWGHGSGIDYIYLYSDSSDSLDKPASGQKATDTPELKKKAAKLEQKALAIPIDVINPNTENANRYIREIQLKEILGDYQKKLNRKINILGFDSCLMGMAEICQQVSDSVEFVIASGEEIPKGSFPYDTILQDLNAHPGMDSSSLSVAIISRFMERYAEESEATRISLSAYRLEESEQLANAVTAFVKAVVGQIDTVRNRVLLARDFSRTPEVPDYIDLGVFCDEIMLSFAEDKNEDKDIHNSAKRIRAVLAQTQYILYHRDAGPEGIATPSGLVIYFPQKKPPTSIDSIQQLVDNQTVQHLSRYMPPDQGMKHTGTDTRKTLLVFTTPTSGRTAPDRTTEMGVEIVERQLVGSEVLWDDYTKLTFNLKTKWADMVEKLITQTPQPASGKAPSYPRPKAGTRPRQPYRPNTENAAQ